MPIAAALAGALYTSELIPILSFSLPVPFSESTSDQETEEVTLKEELT
jgi:hypothetical protein